MKIVYDNGESNINRIPMAYACCDKCEKPVRFALGFVNKPLINPWDKEEHKYCERCGAFMDWKTVSIENQYKIFLADHDKQIREEVYKEIAPLLEDIVTMDNICEAIGDAEWCEKNCGSTDKCLAKYLEQLKGV